MESKKWCIKGGTELESYKKFQSWPGNNNEFAGNVESYYLFNGTKLIDYIYTPDFDEYPEITLKQLKQIVEGKNKEIIGYKCPTDLFRGNIVAGTLYIQDGNDFTFMYKPHNCIVGSKWSLPEDIVTKWEPVYEEEYKVGDYIMVHTLPDRPHWIYETSERIFKLTASPTKFSKEMMWSTSGINQLNKNTGYGLKEENFRKATPEEIDEMNYIHLNDYFVCLDNISGYNGVKDKVYKCVREGGYNLMYDATNGIQRNRCRKATQEEIKNYVNIQIGSYTAEKEGDKVGFGCQKFTKQELQTIQRLFNKEINAKLEIQGVSITSEIIDSLFKLF